MAYIGDKYDTDAIGAHQAGLHGFWLDRANDNATTTVNADIRVIHSLNELQDILTARNSELRLEC